MDKPNTEQLKDKLAEQYDKFAARAHELFAAGREKSNEALHVAIEKAREQMAALGELSEEQAKEFQQYLQRDLEQTARDFHKLGEGAKDKLNPSRIGAGALDSMAALLYVGSEALLIMSIKAEEALTYKAGEITSAGTLTCSNCGHASDFSQTHFVQLCPQCKRGIFKKSY